ncbi:hypothetical protein [Terrabacter terrigena]|uniref:J domain-containing protein n=1 Tax=Terrabacter terrigena TaxID=574718 RepID=A0ABW3MZQ5_9MICO
MSGPRDPALRSRWVRQRRRTAAAHHPDRGGDTESYLSALAAVDRAFGVDEAVQREAAANLQVHVRHSWRGSRMRVSRRARRVARTVRSRLPRSFPGARRTTEI